MSKFLQYLFKAAAATGLLQLIALGVVWCYEHLSNTPRFDLRTLTLWLFGLAVAPMLVYWVYLFFTRSFVRYRYTLREETTFGYFICSVVLGYVLKFGLVGVDHAHQYLLHTHYDTAAISTIVAVVTAQCHYLLGMNVESRTG